MKSLEGSRDAYRSRLYIWSTDVPAGSKAAIPTLPVYHSRFTLQVRSPVYLVYVVSCPIPLGQFGQFDSGVTHAPFSTSADDGPPDTIHEYHTPNQTSSTAVCKRGHEPTQKQRKEKTEKTAYTEYTE